MNPTAKLHAKLLSEMCQWGVPLPESNLQDEIQVHKAEKAQCRAASARMWTGGARSDGRPSQQRCDTSVADKELEEWAEALRKVAVEEGYIRDDCCRKRKPTPMSVDEVVSGDRQRRRPQWQRESCWKFND